MCARFFRSEMPLVWLYAVQAFLFESKSLLHSWGNTNKFHLRSAGLQGAFHQVLMPKQNYEVWKGF